MSSSAVQTSFTDLGTPLHAVTFVVVDLETTGGSARSDAITEVGAVKTRAGELLGEFQTLVRPSTPIPPFIAVLTGITDAMVAGAPPIGTVLPAFLEFARGSVLVAHNAPFDVGFLRAGAKRLALPWPAWPGYAVVDTVRLARRVLTRDEAPNCKLSTLARLFRTQTEPCHRALADARATVDVLHGLLERVGNLGVHTLEELVAFSSAVPETVRRKRHLAEGLPTGPGVYLFRDGRGRPLYVGKSRHVRARVRSYFTGAETRRRMTEMVRLAECVDAIPCATELEAEIRELRMIAEHDPPYNRRSRRQHDGVWLKLTAEPFPRLSVVRAVRADGGRYVGPFGNRRGADDARTALHAAIPLRQCTSRLPARPQGTACVLAEIGRCGAPCDGSEDRAAYAAHVERAAEAMTADVRQLVYAVEQRLADLASVRRYEQAAAERDRFAAFLHATARWQRLTAVAGATEMVAARRAHGGWDVAVIRFGRLAAAGHAPRGNDPWPTVRALVASAESVPRPTAPLQAATAEETACLARWLASDGVRLVALDGVWSSPAYGAGTAGRARRTYTVGWGRD